MAAIRVTVDQIDRRAFFSAVRASGVAGKPLKQKTVESLEAILDEWQRRFPKGLDLRWIAYTMATARHEAWSPRAQEILYDIGEIGGANRSYGRTGYFGRGLTQITHKDNYERAGARFGVDLVAQPWLACRKDISAGCLILGSFEGWYRGDSRGRHKLSRYFDENTDDPVGARNIINGDVGKNGALVARHHAAFLRALAGSLRAKEQPAPQPSPTPLPPAVEPPMPVPVPAPPDPVLPPKPWYRSRTLIGGVLAVVVPLLSTYAPWLAGVDIDAATTQIITAIDLLCTLAGGFLIVQGRLSATRPIAGTQASEDVAIARMQREAELRNARAEVPPGYVPEGYAQPVQEAWDEREQQTDAGTDLASVIARMPFDALVQQVAAVQPWLLAGLTAAKTLSEARERQEEPRG